MKNMEVPDHCYDVKGLSCYLDSWGVLCGQWEPSKILGEGEITRGNRGGRSYQNSVSRRLTGFGYNLTWVSFWSDPLPCLAGSFIPSKPAQSKPKSKEQPTKREGLHNGTQCCPVSSCFFL